MRKNIAIETCSFLLIFLFVYAAGSKLLGFNGFGSQLSRFPYIGRFALPIAIAVPTVEFIVSGLLLFPRTKRIGFYSSFILLALFTIYLTIMVATKSHLPCSCGGVIQRLSWKQHIFFNLFFLALAFLGIRLSRAT